MAKARADFWGGGADEEDDLEPVPYDPAIWQTLKTSR